MTPMTIEQALGVAVGHHQSGRLAEAEALYRQVLSRSPDHPEALHLLGVLAGQVGRTEVAIELIGRAIAVNPMVALYHSNLGEVFRRAGQSDRAVAHCLRAIELMPDAADHHSNLGCALKDQGRLDEAIAAYHRAIALKPDHAETYDNLGTALRDRGRLVEAIAAYHRAIALRPGFAEAYSNLGDALKDLGRIEEALGAYRQAIALNPNLSQTHNNLGCVLMDRGRLDEAIDAYHRAIVLSPGYAAAHSNLGSALTDQGRLDEAIAAYRRAIELQPDLAEAHNNLGCALKDRGRLDEAIDAYRRAIALRPDLPQTYNNLGCTLKDQGRMQEAIDAYRCAIQLKPDYAEAHDNLGTALRDRGRLAEAVAAYQRAIQLKPDHAKAHNNLGLALSDQGRLDAAIAAYRRAIALKPGDAAAHSNLGNALKDQGRLAEAIAAHRHAIALQPDLAATYSNLGCALTAQGRLEEAIAAFHRAIALEPDLAMAHDNLSRTLKDQGRIDEALACYRRAVELKPDFIKAASNLLFTLNLHPDYDARAILAEHRAWARRFAEPLAASIRPHQNDPAPERSLRIGFVSPDFRDHPLGRLLLPLFAHHDRRQAQFVCYSDVRAADETTRRFQALAAEWHETANLDDPELAERIRGDGIDILVDLALHTAGNRLLVFARKPAPLQVTMLGMPGTTGLDTIDFRVTDVYFDPPGSHDADYSERSIRLPHTFWCYQPPEDSPPVARLPAYKNGFVTFGCLNQLAKVSPHVLKLWVKILQSLPGSQLVLHAPAGAHRDSVRALFADAGIAADRLGFDARVPLRDYLVRHHELDLCLDPFPYSGGLTTMDALWMGVPVITLAGRTAVGRSGVSILSNVGLTELIVETPEQYVACAVALAGDLDRLSELRGGLRQRMEASPLVDGKQYALDVEAAFRRIWRTWCNR